MPLVETYWIALEPVDLARGVALAQLANFSAPDALHVSFAERGKADVLLTTGDRSARRAARRAAGLAVPVGNPLSWLARTFPTGAGRT